MKTKPEKAFDVLSSLVSEHRAAQTNLASEQKYFDGINEEIRQFSLTGDLRNEKAVAAIATKHVRLTFLPIRITNLSEQVQAIESKIEEQNQICTPLILRMFSTLQCGHAEIASKLLMAEPFCLESFAARRQGFKTPRAIAAARREQTFRSLKQYGENGPVEIAGEILKLVQPLKEEVAGIVEQIGDIPSLDVMLGSTPKADETAVAETQISETPSPSASAAETD